MSNDNLLATVDLGSNSFRLLIAKILADGSIIPIDQIKQTVRLANGLDENNYLTEESQLLALEVLSRFHERLTGLRKDQVRVVATSTFRIAQNATKFITVANKTLGFPIEIISGTEEARLIYLGAAHSLAFHQNKRVVADIGGGSTEFIIGRGYETLLLESVTMGCVSFTNRYFTDGLLLENNFNNAILAARSKIQAMEHLLAKQNWVEAIGTSGTARVLYEISIQNGFADKITYDGLQKLKKLLLKLKYIKNINIPGLKEDRVAVIAGGLSIMIAIFEELNIHEMSIADGALREGVMYDLLGRNTNHDLRPVTVNNLKNRYSLDFEQAKRVAAFALNLFRSIVPVKEINNERTKLLEWACELYEIGLTISHNDYHKHGAYIIQNSDLAGFSKPEQGDIADLIRSHRGNLKRIADKFQKIIYSKTKYKVVIAIMCFRLSVIFNRSRHDIDFNSIIKTLPIVSNEFSGFSLVIKSNWLNNNPLTLFSLNEEIQQWQAYGYDIKVIGS